MTLGDKLKQLRQAKDWTQPEASGMIGIEQSYLSKLENGKSMPSNEVFEQLLKGYELTIHELIGDLTEAERDKLSDITAVNSYVAIAKGKAQKNSDRWTKNAIISIVLGAGLFFSGHDSIFFPEIRYEYAYDGSEIIEAYVNNRDSIMESRGFNIISEEEAKNKLRELGPKPVVEEEFMASWDYMGSIIQSGDKTFHLFKERHVDSWHNKVLMMLGLMGMVAGALMIALMRKWRR